MKVSDFDFILPPELIAQNPAVPRDSSRLLVYDRLTDSIEHAQVKDLPRFLKERTTLVANNTKVRHSRLYASWNQRQIEVLVLEPTEPKDTYLCMLRGKGIPAGAELAFQSSEKDTTPIPLQGTITGKEDGPAMTTFAVRFESEIPVEEAFSKYGTVPLPPYIDNSQAQPDQYQTVFAGETGSAAAPTAGLHFTPELIENLIEAGHAWQEVTLHVGMGTFLPLRQEEVTENHLHKEAAYVSSEAADTLNQKLAANERVLAIGTTSTRTLESHIGDDVLVPGWKQTDLFIYPGHTFKAINGLLTNFHLPKSSLLLLVAAFIGNHPDRSGPFISEQEMIFRLRRIYQEAIRQQYRFFSFGDAMLIL